MQPKTNVFITIDLECRRNSPSYESPIYGQIENQSKSFGLDFILKTFQEFNLKSTFFIEPFFSYKFGQNILKNICENILTQKQDIQLHLHPYFKSSKDKEFEDALHTYDLAQQVSLIEEGKEILKNCGVNRIDAFRAGAFAANNTTYQALKASNIPISSNYNLDYLRKCCKISLSKSFNDAFYEQDILEIPTTCFEEFNFSRSKKRFRHMQITAVSFPEMRYILENAPKWNLQNITILLHTFEFINFTDESKSIGNFNYTNINRFRKLCEFLSKNSSKFEVKGMSDIDKRSCINSGEKYIPSMPIYLTSFGKYEQIKKRLLK
jgi:hypothetical protein